MARFVFENIQNDFLGGVNVFGPIFNFRSNASIFTLKMS